MGAFRVSSCRSLSLTAAEFFWYVFAAGNRGRGRFILSGWKRVTPLDSGRPSVVDSPAPAVLGVCAAGGRVSVVTYPPPPLSQSTLVGGSTFVAAAATAEPRREPAEPAGHAAVRRRRRVRAVRVDPLGERRVLEGVGDLLRVRVAQPDRVDLVELHAEQRRLGDLAAGLGAGVAVEQLRVRRPPLDLKRSGSFNAVLAARQAPYIHRAAVRSACRCPNVTNPQLVPEISCIRHSLCNYILALLGLLYCPCGFYNATVKFNVSL